MSNYEDAGLDAFLSRSIDNLTQVNLSSPGPVSNQIAYDRTQISGQLGDILQIGNIGLDGADGGINLKDGPARTMFIGKDSQGNQVVKIAKSGYDAKEARDDQLNFNSQQNILKVVKTGIEFVESNGAPISYSTVAHGLGFAPVPLVYLNDVNLSPIAAHANIPLPTYSNVTVDTSNQRINFGTWLHAIADADNLYVVLFNSLGISIKLNYKYFLLQESINKV